MAESPRRPVPQAVHPAPVVIVQADTLPPVMHRIARCESRGQHFTKEGKVVRGKRHAADIGLFQINTVVWGKKAQELGHNIHTQEGNTRMARYRFDHDGSVPWQSSAACWNRRRYPVRWRRRSLRKIGRTSGMRCKS